MEAERVWGFGGLSERSWRFGLEWEKQRVEEMLGARVGGFAIEFDRE